MNGQHPSTSKRFAAELLAGTLIGLSLLGPACAETAPAGASGAIEATTQPDLWVAPSELRDLLSALLTSQDRIALAEKLESALRNGDITGAERDLGSAVEVGTLAAILTEYLRSPNLLIALQDHGIKGTSSPQSSGRKEQATTLAACSASDARIAELQQSLEQERAHSGLVAKTLTDLMQENNGLKTRLETETSSQASTVTETQKALQWEQEQREALARDLANLQNDYRTLQEAQGQSRSTAAANMAELEARLRQEQEKSDNAARQLTAMAQELDALQSFRSEATATSTRMAETEKALARERMQSEILIQELINTSEELRTLREPYQANATPLVYRIAAKGADVPLPKAEPIGQGLEASPVPQIESDLPDVTSTVQKAAPAPVVIAALPGTVQALPVTAKPVEGLKASPDLAVRNSPSPDAVKLDDRLVTRADELLRNGDVSGARLLLERSLASGNARAAFLMAETFDPNVLSKLRVLGIRGDPAKAQEYYARARDLGIAQAGERMEALK